jgi:predicted nucleic acid-binding protein
MAEMPPTSERNVVDASVAVKWLLDEPGTDHAMRLLEGWAEQHSEIVAPSLLLVEVGNVLLQRTRRGQLDPAGVEVALRELGDIPIAIVAENATSTTKALTLAHAYGLSALYDAIYLQLAKDLECAFWTADQRLVHSLQGKLPWVHLLGENPG